MAAVTDSMPSAPGIRRLGSYVRLMKPRIIELLLATALPTMFLAADGLPDLWTVVWVLVGGTLAAGGANALNSYADRDIDALMARTAHRPLVTGEITPAPRWCSECSCLRRASSS